MRLKCGQGPACGSAFRPARPRRDRPGCDVTGPPVVCAGQEAREAITTAVRRPAGHAAAGQVMLSAAASAMRSGAPRPSTGGRPARLPGDLLL